MKLLRTLLPLLALAWLFAGCAASTQLVTNDKASEAVKARSYRSYKEVLFVPPKEDKRNIAPRIVGEIERMGFQVRVLDPNKPIEPAQGTGFLVGDGTWVLTCAHVMGEQTVATLTLGGKRLLADVVKADAKADLALLRLRGPAPEGTAPIAFRAAAKPATMGEDVFTIGYPMSRLLGNSARMSKGLLSATAGLKDNPNEVQVSAEIHPGNSGGPLLDREGNVIGVVNKTINPAAVAQATGGALPQNVNFAIKAQPVLDFVKGADEKAWTALQYDRAGGLEQANKGVARVQAGEVPTDAERHDKMLVRLAYVSMWDMWYRFRVFVLAAFDYESQEPLFIAGQGRDNLVSNEDVVIRDTLDQFRKAINSR